MDLDMPQNLELVQDVPVTIIVPIKDNIMPLTVKIHYCEGDGGLTAFGSTEHETPNRYRCEVKKRGRPSKVYGY